MNVNVTIEAIMPIFETHVIPEHVVTDNGVIFRSEECKRFMAQEEILHTKTAPFHSNRNGEVERFFSNFKEKYEKIKLYFSDYCK